MHEIAIALLPIGGGVAGHRLHVDVVGEQIVAAVRLLIRAVEEILGLEALADQRALHVGKADHDGVDLAVGDGLLQLVEGEVSGRYACAPGFAKRGPRVDPRGPLSSRLAGRSYNANNVGAIYTGSASWKPMVSATR